jgi:hypothetical protein
LEASWGSIAFVSGASDGISSSSSNAVFRLRAVISFVESWERGADINE